MVSVVLPVYNGEATIVEAVVSVLEQSCCDLELLVIDDGSTDSTRDLLCTITDQRLQVFSWPQTGLAASRNRGVERARGDYLAFIDADDVWLPEKLMEQLAAFRRMPDAMVAYCWTDYMDAQGNFVCPDSRATFEGCVYEQLLVRNFIDCGSIIMVRRQVLLDAGGYDESLPVIEDWDLNIRLAALHPFVCIPRALVRYRQSATSMSTQVGLMEETFWRVIDRAFEQAPTALLPLKQRSAAFFYEYLTGKVTQAVPDRGKGLAALRFFGLAVRSHPAILLGLWQRPWVLKSLAKAMLAIVLPAAVMQRLAGRDN